MHFRFYDTLTSADTKRHIHFYFDVPGGATRLDIRFDYTPKRIDGIPGDNLLSLSLFDPQGVRGAGHSRPNNDISISAVEATPGYRPGALPPGRWVVVIDTHLIHAEAPVTFLMDIDISSEAVQGQAPQFVKGQTARRGPGWYRGDLHGHTIHSDGHWDVSAFARYARDCHLDFVTLTDHNTVSGLAELDSCAGDDLLTMGGMELTTYYGHCLALGTRRWVDWRILPGVTMIDIARRILDSGAYFVIAHPRSIGDPQCTGCDWLYPEMMPGIAPAVEIWNGPWTGDSHNEQALERYYQWLNQGHRLVATAGTDIHGPTLPEPTCGFNVVYAEELTEPAVLAAIRQGHLYLSSGPRVEFTARTASRAWVIPGDRLPADDVTVSVRWSQAPTANQVRLIAGGQVVATRDANEQGEAEWPLPAGQYSWCLVEIRDAAGEMLAITNPIFLGG